MTAIAALALNSVALQTNVSQLSRIVAACKLLLEWPCTQTNPMPDAVTYKQNCDPSARHWSQGCSLASAMLCLLVVD